ncbi:hypothetical protein D3C80_2155250 [compost metagenome]
MVPLQPVAPDSNPPFVTRSVALLVPTVSVALFDVAVTAGEDESVTVALNTAPLSAATVVKL